MGDNSDKPPFKAALSRDVWKWPEFQAFTKRLRIDVNTPTTNLTIRIPLGEVVSITQEFYGSDCEREK